CVAIALLHKRPKLRAIATDISPAALAIAKLNAEKHAVADRIDLRETDLLANVTERVRFVVANPPYIRDDERTQLAPEVRDHEPHVALFGEGADGLGHHRRILEQAARVVVDGGFVAVEIGASQGAMASSIAVDGFGAP